MDLTRAWDLLNLPLPATIVGTVVATALITLVALIVRSWRRRRPPAPAAPSPTRRPRWPLPPPATPADEARRKQALANVTVQIERYQAEQKNQRKRALARALEAIERQFGKGSVMRVGDAHKKQAPSELSPEEPPKDT